MSNTASVVLLALDDLEHVQVVLRDWDAELRKQDIRAMGTRQARLDDALSLVARALGLRSPARALGELYSELASVAAERDRWAARVKELESRIGDAVLRLQGRGLTPSIEELRSAFEERLARVRVERDPADPQRILMTMPLPAELGTCELCDEPAVHLAGEEALPICEGCYQKHKDDDGDDLQAEGSDEEAQT